MKLFSEAAERNKLPILEILRIVFVDRSRVLEIGSGTGQHAVYFAPLLLHLTWQPTELPNNLSALRACCDENPVSNLAKPVGLNVDDEPWLIPAMDAVYTANTLHIVSWQQVCRMFSKVGNLLPAGGIFCSYGPFNRDGCYTSESNANFDAYLRASDPKSGLRDIGKLVLQAKANGLFLITDHAMPANNRLLVWRKLSRR
jgi:cyclopropane fatty-acyl-phospholipid synthase-like methyltransferase